MGLRYCWNSTLVYAPADLCAAGPHRLTGGDCNEAPRGEERAQGWRGVQEMPRNWEFQSLHVSANRLTVSRAGRSCDEDQFG
jgi:hypothetical protein